MRDGVDGAERSVETASGSWRVIAGGNGGVSTAAGGAVAAGENGLVAAAREEMRRRNDRRLVLGPELLAEPAWDMMLDLYLARAAGRRIAVSSLCVAAGVPTTTALRWIRLLEENGFLIRDRDRSDRRRSFVDLTPAAREKVELLLRRGLDRISAG